MQGSIVTLRNGKIHCPFLLQRPHVASKQMALRLQFVGAPQLAAKLYGAKFRGAEMPQPASAHQRADQVPRAERVRLHSEGLADVNVPGSHRGQEHVTRVLHRGEFWMGFVALIRIFSFPIETFFALLLGFLYHNRRHKGTVNSKHTREISRSQFSI